MRLLHGSRYSYVKLEQVHTDQAQVEQGKGPVGEGAGTGGCAGCRCIVSTYLWTCGCFIRHLCDLHECSSASVESYVEVQVRYIPCIWYHPVLTIHPCMTSMERDNLEHLCLLGGQRLVITAYSCDSVSSRAVSCFSCCRIGAVILGFSTVFSSVQILKCHLRFIWYLLGQSRPSSAFNKRRWNFSGVDNTPKGKRSHLHLP